MYDTEFFQNPAKMQEKGKKEKSASPVEIVRDEAHLNNPVKDIHMNIKRQNIVLKVVLLNVFDDEKEISHETTLDGIVRENELRMS